MRDQPYAITSLACSKLSTPVTWCFLTYRLGCADVKLLKAKTRWVCTQSLLQAGCSCLPPGGGCLRAELGIWLQEDSVLSSVLAFRVHILCNFNIPLENHCL